MNELISRLDNYLKQQREEALVSAAFIQAKEKKLAFLKKVNYNIGLIELIKTEMEADKETIMEQDCILNSINSMLTPEEPVKSLTAIIKEKIFFKGKEAARAFTISRARELWPELY